MKKIVIIAGIFILAGCQLRSQTSPDYSRIDLLMLRGEFERAADTCRSILKNDSLNPEICFRAGQAYQNLLIEDSSLIWFEKAVRLSPDNRIYNFTLAREYYGDGKPKLAEPYLTKIYLSDTLNWAYAFYLTGIYMQTGKYDDAIKIYERFVKKDSSNCVYLDKMGFAYLKKGDLAYATELYNKSMSYNDRDLTAIKNLSYLYASQMNVDTAIYLLTKGIKIDSADMDLRLRRAQLNYSKNYTKRALDDYLVILASGDSSKLYLKRIGIGYCYNLQPEEAEVFLLKAYKADSTDYETCSYLGQCYYKTGEMDKSARYYSKAAEILEPVYMRLALTYNLCADSQSKGAEFKSAIDNYLKAYSIGNNYQLLMNVANIYDEKLDNKEKAIIYYQKFLNANKSAKYRFPDKYIEKIEKRLDYLKKESSPTTKQIKTETSVN